MVKIIDAGIAVLLGILVTALIAHLLNKDRDVQIREFIKLDSARRALELAFMEVLILLEVKPPIDPKVGNEWQNTGKLLKGFYKKHRLAIWQFERILSPSKRNSFRDIWNEYCCYNKDTHEATFSDYENEGIEKEPKKRHLAISRIEKLLKFTK